MNRAFVRRCASSVQRVQRSQEGASRVEAIALSTQELARHARARRVWCLVSLIVLLSLADLFLTMTYLQSVGMGEANPVARVVMSYNSPALLVAWKCATVSLAVLIFAVFRHRRSAEVACWLCAIVLVALTAHWMNYNQELPMYANVIGQNEAGIFMQMTN